MFVLHQRRQYSITLDYIHYPLHSFVVLSLPFRILLGLIELCSLTSYIAYLRCSITCFQQLVRFVLKQACYKAQGCVSKLSWATSLCLRVALELLYDIYIEDIQCLCCNAYTKPSRFDNLCNFKIVSISTICWLKWGINSKRFLIKISTL